MKRIAMIALAASYIGGVWLDGMGSKVPADVLPRPLLYFVQIATLFPNAAVVSIDYRAEGWRCADRRWAELDTRAYFPMHADDKENRYHRLLHFYRRHRATLQALERHLIDAHNGGLAASGSAADSIGGIRLLSLRIPFPKPGEPVERYRRRPLSEYPESRRHYWYSTPASKRKAQCAEQSR